MGINEDAFTWQYLPLYSYLARAYSRFKLTGRCLDFPMTLQVQTQSRCNGRCLICPYSIVSKQLEQGTMSCDLYSKIIDEVTSASFPVHMIYELHNEPLIDKRIFDWIGHFKSKNPGNLTRIATNGELLDQFSIEEIRASNLDYIVISLNAGSKETFEAINLNLNYDRIMDNINSLLENDVCRQKVGLSFVVTELNKQEVYPAVQYWRQKGIATRIVKLANRAGSLTNYDSLKTKNDYNNPGIISRLRNSLMSPVRNVLGCSLPFYQMNVLFNGDVILCCHDWERATVLGNVAKSSISEIWNSEKLNKVRRQILDKNYKEIKACSNCSSAI
jgi:radical SAM protein with 4Fe4S-binding SPASM domain